MGSSEFRFTDAKTKDDINHITKVHLARIKINVPSSMIKRIVNSRAKSIIKGIENKNKIMFTGIGSFRIKKFREYYLRKDGKLNCKEFSSDVVYNEFKVKE